MDNYFSIGNRFYYRIGDVVRSAHTDGSETSTEEKFCSIFNSGSIGFLLSKREYGFGIGIFDNTDNDPLIENLRVYTEESFDNDAFCEDDIIALKMKSFWILIDQDKKVAIAYPPIGPRFSRFIFHGRHLHDIIDTGQYEIDMDHIFVVTRHLEVIGFRNRRLTYAKIVKGKFRYMEFLKRTSDYIRFCLSYADMKFVDTKYGVIIYGKCSIGTGIEIFCYRNRLLYNSFEVTRKIICITDEHIVLESLATEKIILRAIDELF